MKTPFFSIITPSIQRSSLIDTCLSVNSQTIDEELWEHIVVIDCEEINTGLISRIESPRRTIAQCSVPHKNSGNTCRHNAWELATGEYLIHLDDDNFFTDKHVLKLMHYALVGAGKPLVAFFPILRLGSIFFPDGEPRRCHVDSANLVVHRSVGQWPDIAEYTADGIFVESLVSKYSYKKFEGFKPIINMPVISFNK